MAFKCINNELLLIDKLFAWLLTMYNSMGIDLDGADLYLQDWSFPSSCVKSIFYEIKLLRIERQLDGLGPTHEAQACMQTMALQEELADDFSAHEIVIKVLHTHIQRKGTLKEILILRCLQ